MRAQDKVIQAKPDRTSVTILGHFMRWAKGTEPKRSVMLFGHGERCYNGPMRSTRVEVACGDGTPRPTRAARRPRCARRGSLNAPPFASSSRPHASVKI